MNIFITGGTSGIGLELGKTFLERGHNVAVSSFEKPDDIKGKIPAEFTYYEANVIDQKRMSEIIYDYKNKVGSLDMIIANAGISMPKEKIPDFDRGRFVVNVNVIGVINTLEPAIKIMNEQKKGHIVGLGSVSGLTGMPGMAIYGASKAAVINMFETFAIDLPPLGIDVTCVAPGFIKTPLTDVNNHKMPFLLSPAQAVEEILYAIDNKKAFHIFPVQMNFTSSVLKRMPRFMYRKIMGLDLMGFTKH